MQAVNLLPTELRERGGTPHRSAPVGGYIVLAALLLALVATWLHTSTVNDIDRNARTVTAVQAEVAVVQAQAARLRPYQTEAIAAQARIAGVRALAGSRFPWDRTFVDVARALPAAAHVTSLDAGVNADAGGASAVRSALDVPAVVVKGCVDRQGDIPDLLTRLGDLRGATRVVLGSSKSAGGGGAPSASACRRSSAPTFDVTVFFGDWRSTVPATTTVGGAATSPTPAASPTAAPSAAPSSTAATPSPGA